MFPICGAQKGAFATPRTVSGAIEPCAITARLLVQQKACRMIPRHELPENQKITEARSEKSVFMRRTTISRRDGNLRHPRRNAFAQIPRQVMQRHTSLHLGDRLCWAIARRCSLPSALRRNAPSPRTVMTQSPQMGS